MKGSTRVWGAAAVLLAANGPAQAFYWYDWPGDKHGGPSLVSPKEARPFPVNPPLEVTTPMPPVGPPVPVDRTPVGPPTHTPEPATGLIGLVGLAAVAARKWRSTRRKS